MVNQNPRSGYMLEDKASVLTERIYQQTYCSHPRGLGVFSDQGTMDHWDVLHCRSHSREPQVKSCWDECQHIKSWGLTWPRRWGYPLLLDRQFREFPRHLHDFSMLKWSELGELTCDNNVVDVFWLPPLCQIMENPFLIFNIQEAALWASKQSWVSLDRFAFGWCVYDREHLLQVILNQLEDVRKWGTEWVVVEASEKQALLTNTWFQAKIVRGFNYWWEHSQRKLAGQKVLPNSSASSPCISTYDSQYIWKRDLCMWQR